jgi:hypothetical protein
VVMVVMSVLAFLSRNVGFILIITKRAK